MKYRVADLFCGAGGFSQATVGTPFDVAVAVDNWARAISTYRANMDHPCIEADIQDINNIVNILALANVNTIVGGPPCQDFSAAGKRQEGERAALTTVFANIITRILPDIFVMENVPGALKSNAYAEAKNLFGEAGYSLSESVVDAAYFDVPQHRKRLIVAGSRTCDMEEFDDFLDLFACYEAVTVRDYWPDVPFGHYYNQPRSYQRRGVFSVDEPSPTIRGISRPRPATYKPHPGDSTTEVVSALSYQDRARIQTFPPDYVWQGSKTDINQQIGNSIPPLLARNVFWALDYYHNANGHPPTSIDHPFRKADQ